MTNDRGKVHNDGKKHWDTVRILMDSYQVGITFVQVIDFTFYVLYRFIFGLWFKSNSNQNGYTHKPIDNYLFYLKILML